MGWSFVMTAFIASDCPLVDGSEELIDLEAFHDFVVYLKPFIHPSLYKFVRLLIVSINPVDKVSGIHKRTHSKAHSFRMVANARA